MVAVHPCQVAVGLGSVHFTVTVRVAEVTWNASNASSSKYLVISLPHELPLLHHAMGVQRSNVPARRPSRSIDEVPAQWARGRLPVRRLVRRDRAVIALIAR